MPIQKKKITEPLTVDEAVVALERFCAYQDRYAKEIRQKIKEYQLSPEDAEVIVKYLIDDNFINDARYADAYVRGKIRSNHWGAVKIRLALLTKGIAEKWVDAALGNFPKEEYNQILRELATRKQESLTDESEFDQRQKISASLYRAGFETDLVLEVVNELFTGRSK
jgi:regulatory protein